MPRSKGKKPRKVGKGSILSHMQRVFVDIYEAQGFTNADAACRKAGYAHRQNSYRLLIHPLIEAEVLKRKERAAAKLSGEVKLDRKWVLEQYQKWAKAPAVLAKFKVVGEDGRITWDFTGATQDELALITELGTETDVIAGGGKTRVLKHKMKIGTVDPKAAVDSIARVLGLNNDKLQVGGELSLVERLQRGRERAAQKGT